MKKLECPCCESTELRVVTTLHTDDGDWVRRRLCTICGHRWYTYQPMEEHCEDGDVAFTHKGGQRGRARLVRRTRTAGYSGDRTAGGDG